ncbi:MAG: TetR/AcrR family transcriptional regulator [Oscillospiraceae bacterium]|jgi:AcrR family transcriptional regulator|nr:TetR/AcrR family transcriptional regulator [Oscillospiraceae bacterium]
MSGNFKKEDLRIIKTRKGLTDALHTLLRRYSFSKISVYDICAEAMVSRSAFYTHFSDKYALLEYWLSELRRDLAERISDMPVEQLEHELCGMFRDNVTVCANLLGEADRELFALLVEYLPPNIPLTEKERENRKMDVCHAVLSDFLAGGLFSLIVRRVRTRQLSDEQIRATVLYAYNMVRAIVDWDAAQNITEAVEEHQ